MPTRAKRRQRDEARHLVALWFRDRCEEREERFRAVNGGPVMLQSTRAIERLTQAAQPWDQPLTADGKATKQHEVRPGLRLGIDLNANGGYTLDERRERAKLIMRHVGEFDPGARDALEMMAAGYNVEAIAEEMGCGERMARGLLDDGLAVVQSCILLYRKRTEFK